MNLQHKCLQKLQLLALHFEIEDTLHFLLLEFLSIGDIRGDKQTFK